MAADKTGVTERLHTLRDLDSADPLTSSNNNDPNDQKKERLPFICLTASSMMSLKRKKSQMTSLAPKWTHALSIEAVKLGKGKKLFT